MSVWNVPFSMSVSNNPITDSLYVESQNVGFDYPVPGEGNLMTEGGTFILTEGLVNLSTE